MKAIINHMNTDPNAEKHVELGQLGSLAGVFCIVLSMLWHSYSIDGFIAALLIGAFVGSMTAGVCIELVQRWQRRDGWNFFGEGQNSIKESVLDALVTGLWPLWYIK